MTASESMRADQLDQRDHNGHVALIGMMGCGKTTVGKLLAAQLDRACMDLDAVLVKEQKRSIPNMFAEQGEAWFRDAEAELLERTLRNTTQQILSLGGGAPMRASNRLVMREHATVVWLRAQTATLLSRAGSGVGRPVLGNDPTNRIITLTAERGPIYQDASHIVIDVDDLSAPQAVECIRAAIRCMNPDHWAA